MRVFSPVHVLCFALMLFFKGRGFLFFCFLLESEVLMRNGTAIMQQCSREDAGPFSGNSMIYELAPLFGNKCSSCFSE